MNALTFARHRLLLTSALVAGAAAVSPLGAGLALAQTETTAGDVLSTTPFAPPADAPVVTDVAGGVQVDLKVQKSVINWRHFNVVDPGRTINFSDLSGLPAGTVVSVLNRVVGNGVDPIEASVINGMISSSSNVVVWISNPMGITFGSSGVFSGGSLVLTTAAITTSDFRGADDNYALTGASSAAITLSSGSQINAAGRFVAAGQNITNGGSITAGGDVALIAAQDIDLSLAPGSPIGFTIKAGTTVGSAKLNSDGTINASSITLTGAGRRTAGSESDLLLEINGTLTATAVGGKVFLGMQRDAGDDTIGGNNDAMKLIGDTTLVGSTVDIASALDSDGTARSLDIQGNAVLRGALGATSALSAVSVSGTTQLDAGSVTTTGTQSYNGAVTLGAATTLTGTSTTFGSTVDGAQSLGISGDAVFKGVVGGTTALASLSVGGATEFDGGSVTTTGAQTYANAVTLKQDATLSGSSIAFGSTVQSDVDGGAGLTTTATSGKTLFTSAVGGGGKALKSLTTNGLTEIAGGSVVTKDAQAYNGAVVLTADTTLTSNDGGAITFSSTVDSDAGQTRSLTTATTGLTTFSGKVGSTDKLSTLTVNGASALNAAGTLAAASIQTTGQQTYTGAVTLGAQTVLGGTTMTFGSTVDGAQVLGVLGNAVFKGAVGATTALHTMGINGTTEIDGGSVKTNTTQVYIGAVKLGANTVLSGTTTTFVGGVNGAHSLDISGNAVFAGAVGGSTALTNLSVSGTTLFDGGSAKTTGTQTYTGAVTVKQDAVLEGSDITFGSTLQSDADGGAGLTTTATTGKTKLTGAVGGGGKALKFLTTNGLTEIAGGSVITKNAQTYNGAVVLAADTTLTSNDGGAITFGSTVDSDTGQTRSLTTSSTGRTVFNRRVGATDKLSTLTVSGPSTLNVAGTLGAPSIQTTGTQTYAGAVTLAANTVLSGTTATFGSTVDGAHSLDVLGDAVFKGAVGGVTALTALSVDGTTVFDGGSAKTTGNQTYTGAVTLKQDAALEGGDITFLSTVQSDADGSAGLTTTASGKTRFTGAVGGAGKALKFLTTNGNVEIAGGSVVTKDSQTYNGAVVLAADTTLTSNDGGVIKFGSTVDSDAGQTRSLTTSSTGLTTFGGKVGSADKLSTLLVNGGTVFDATGATTVSTTGTQTYTGAVTLKKDTTLSGTDIVFTSTVRSDVAGGAALETTATGKTRFGGAVGDAGGALKSLTSNGLTEIVGGTVITNQQQFYNGAVILVTDTELLANNLGTISFASTVDSAVGLTRSLRTTTSGMTFFNGRVGATDKLSSLQVDGAAMLSVAGTLGAPSIQTTGAQTYVRSVTLNADTVLSGTTVTFGSPLGLPGGTVNGAHSLDILGAAVFKGAVGGSTALTSLSVSGTTLFDGGSVKTTGNQTYSGAVTLKQDAALEGGDITFLSTVQSDADGGAGLTTTASGKTKFTSAVGGSVGGGKALKFLTTNGNAEIAGGSVITTDAQTYNGAVVLAADTTLTSNDGGAIKFGSTVDSDLGQTRSLTTTSTGLTTFGGKVGSADKLSTLLVNGGTVFDAADPTTVSTTGTQTYTGAVTLKQDTTLSGTNITFASTVQSDTAGGAGLETTATGKTRFGGAVGGGGKALKFLTTNGLAEIAGGSVTTTAAQTYNNAVVLAADTTLTSNDGGAITFGSTVDSDTGQTRALTTSSTGQTVFNGRVGATDKLSTLTVSGPSTLNVAGPLGAPSIQTTGTQTYAGAVTLAANTVLSGTTATFGGTVDGAQSLDVLGAAVFKGLVGGSTALTSLSVSGTTLFDGGSVKTTGNQAYTGAVTVKQDATLEGSDITFASTVRSDADGGAGLTTTVTGKTLFTGAVGDGGKALKFLTVNGNAEIAGGSVTTKGAQTYNGAVVLAADTTLTSNDGGAITFGSTVDSDTGQTRSLTTSSTGQTVFNGRVGATDKLSTLTVGGPATLNVVGALGAPSIQTTATQTYVGAVTLGANTVLSGTTATFGGTVNGAHSLDVLGNAVFKGVVGGATALTALSVSGTTEFEAAGSPTVTTTGTQVYTGAVTLKQDTGLKGSKVTFGSTVKGTKALAVDGDALFKGVVGGNGTAGEVLTSLAVTGKSEFDVAGAAMSPVSATVTTTGQQNYGGAVTLVQDTVFKGSQVSFASIVDGLSAGVQRLGVLGDALFAGDVGGTTRLRSVEVIAPTAITAAGKINALESITLDAGGAITLNHLSTTDMAAGSGNIRINQNGGSGPVVVAGNVSASGDYLLTGTSVVLGDASARTQQARGQVRITATGGNIGQGTGLLTLQSDSDGSGTRSANDPLRVTASNGSVVLGNAVLTGGALAGGVHGKQSDVFVDASQNLTVKEAHGRSIGLRATAGELLADKLEALEDVFGKAGTKLEVTTSAIAGDDLNLAAGGDLKINQGVANGTGADSQTVDLSGAALGVIVDAGAPNLANITLTSAAGNITATTLTAQRDVLVNATKGAALVTSATAVQRDVKVLAAGDAMLSSGSAGNDIVVDAGDNAALGTGTAGNSILVRAVNNATVGNATTANDFVTVQAGKVATVTGDVSAKTDYTVTGGTGVVLGDGTARTQKAGRKVTVTATTNDVTQGAGLLTLQSDSDGSGGDPLAITATAGSVLLGNSVVQGGTGRQSDVAIDAAKNAALAQVDGRNITVISNQIALGGAMTGATSVVLINRTSETNDTVIGGTADSDGTKYVLSATEVGRITAPTIQIVTQQATGVTQNVQLGTFALKSGTNLFGVMTTGTVDNAKITLGGAITGSGFTGTLQLGGNTTAGSQSGSIVGQIDTATIDLPTGGLDLRARQIAFGRSSLLTDPALLSGDAARIARDLVSNAGSSLYIQGSGGAKIDAAGNFLRAKTMRVTYSDYALFQNTGTPGSPAGVILGDATQTVTQSDPTLILDALPTSREDAFALFGTINGFTGRPAGLLPESVVRFSSGTGTGRVVLITQPNSRVNGCVIGAPDKGCLVTDVQPPALKLFDERQAAIFTTADDDNRVLLDPLIATNNEALIGDLAVPTLNYEVPACELNAAGECDKGKK